MPPPPLWRLPASLLLTVLVSRVRGAAGDNDFRIGVIDLTVVTASLRAPWHRVQLFHVLFLPYFEASF